MNDIPLIDLLPQLCLCVACGIALGFGLRSHQKAQAMARELHLAAQGQVWIVGVVTDPQWIVIGVFGTEEEAIAACTSPKHFVGPLTIGKCLSDDTEPWEGAYYPRLHVRN